MDIFKHYNQIEACPYMGDWTFWEYLNDLIIGRPPLLKVVDGSAFKYPPLSNYPDFNSQEIELTPDGNIIIEGIMSWHSENFYGKWLGGVNLKKNNFWCWDDNSQKLFKSI